MYLLEIIGDMNIRRENLMNINLLKKRRKKLFGQLEDNELALIFAASKPGDPDYPCYFLQDDNFLYFTGLEIPDAVFVFCKIKNKPVVHLFIERTIPEMVVWEGEKLTFDKAVKISGIEKISFLDEFERKISMLLYPISKCYVNIGSGNLNSLLSKQQDFIKKTRDRFPHIIFKDITDKMRPLRLIKDKWEIEQLQKAIDITGKGIVQIMKKAQPGMMEYELEAILNYEVTKNGLRHMGFKSIIASGINAATLHYINNNSKIGKNDLILLDVGAACNNYNADISRTFPVSGKFTPRQKAVYQEVLNINKKIIEMVKPGIPLTKLTEKTVELITASLVKLKLITKKEDYKKYYMHNVSHHLGMDAHDIGKRDSILEVGNVITVEPGIYITGEKIGIRIEDDILVTKDGYKNLSIKIPKEIEELENIIRR